MYYAGYDGQYDDFWFVYYEIIENLKVVSEEDRQCTVQSTSHNSTQIIHSRFREESFGRF